MSSSLTTDLALALAASKTASLLAPSGVVSAGVSDLLAAATDVTAIANTANAVLADFLAPITDPIQVAFSQGQPYSGTFITSPTTTLVPLALTTPTTTASTSALSALTCEQISALEARIGSLIATDADLASAMASLFSEFSTIQTLAFSIALDLACPCGCDEFTAVTTATSTIVSYTYSIASITSTLTASAADGLSDFISAIASIYPNTLGIAGVAASVYTSNLGLSVSSSGSTIAGIPQNIAAGIYNDITTNAANLQPTLTPVAVTDYSYQQNLLNTTVALSIDNGLVDTFTGLMTSSMVTPVTTQVILNRLGSVAARGDTAMFLAMAQQLGTTNVPNAASLLATLTASANPTDQARSLPNIQFIAGGLPIVTNTNIKSLSGIASDLTAIQTALGLTTQNVFTQNTCDSVFCSQSLWNVNLMKAASPAVLSSLMDPTTVAMANMFN